MTIGRRSTAVLGFGGLPLHKDFREARLAGLTVQERRIFQGADSAAALAVGGRIVAASAEERYDGVKHSSAFPRGATDHCLSVGGITVADLDIVAHSFSYNRRHDLEEEQSLYNRDLYAMVLDPEANRRVAEEALGVDLRDRFLPVPHHHAHAASAYFPSGHRDALVVVSDGLGEGQSASVFVGESGELRLLAEVFEIVGPLFCRCTATAETRGSEHSQRLDPRVVSVIFARSAGEAHAAGSFKSD